MPLRVTHCPVNTAGVPWANVQALRRRGVDARFREAIGVPPKTAAALVRFNRALRLLRAGERPADVASRCGYSDQPHLTREFRRFTGTTPVAFLQDVAAVAA